MPSASRAGMCVRRSSKPLQKRLFKSHQLVATLLAVVYISSANCVAKQPLSRVHHNETVFDDGGICPWVVGIYAPEPATLQCQEYNAELEQRSSDQMNNTNDKAEHVSPKLEACVATGAHMDPITVGSNDDQGKVRCPETRSVPSYEDWKDLVRSRASSEATTPTDRRRLSVDGTDLNNSDTAMDSHGDNGEIYLNMAGERERAPDPVGGGADKTTSKPGNSKPARDEPHDGKPIAGNGSDDGSVETQGNEALFYDDGRTQYYRSKDAGKTCKERFSYSSFDAGATVLKSSRGAKNAKAILVENKDSYMLMECADDNKYVIIELSDDILVDTVVLANFEFFSSMIRHFRVCVSDRYPVKLDKWKDLGTFEAKNSRDIQSFLVDNPQIWAKYIRVEFLSHFGNEYYCPLSLVRIHGTRMMESWQDVERGEDEDDIDGESQLELLTGSTTDDLGSATSPDLIDINPLADEPGFIQTPQSESNALIDVCWKEPQEWSAEGSVSASDMCLVPRSPIMATLPTPHASYVGFSGDGHQSKYADRLESESTISMTIDAPKALTSSLARAHIPRPDRESDAESTFRPMSSLTEQVDHISRVADSTITSISMAMPGSNKGKPAATSNVTPALPIVQESFFKSITKRLQLLEMNMTSSLKYLEDQSRHINEILLSSERHLLAQVELFIQDVNRTLRVDVRRLHQEYTEVYQLTTVALDRQREQSEREIVALSSRLNLLADEVIFQKRMAIAQAILLLSCLVLVIFTRGIPSPQHTPTAAHIPVAYDAKTTVELGLNRSCERVRSTPSAYRDNDSHPYSTTSAEAEAAEYGASDLAAYNDPYAVDLGRSGMPNNRLKTLFSDPFKYG
jgi:hypothetical protein